MRFSVVWWFLALAISFAFYDGTVNAYNSTLLAFWYKYGLISRGLAGTLYHGFTFFTGLEADDYLTVLHYTQCVYLVLLVVSFLFAIALLKQVRVQYKRPVMLGLFVYEIFVFPMFSHEENFGRLDTYLLILTLLAFLILLKDRWLWLLVPISFMGILFHQGYAFMYYNFLLAALFYRMKKGDSARRRKYGAVLVISLLVCVTAFFYLELFSHGNASSYGEEIIASAEAMSEDGDYHEDVIDKEIYGIDITDRETEYRYIALTSLGAFLVIFSPYLMIFGRFLKGFLAGEKKEKGLYRFLALGGLTLLPLYILKVDYGRWTFALIMYYLLMYLWFYAVEDRGFSEYSGTFFQNIREKCSFSWMLLVALILYQPFAAIWVCTPAVRIASILNTYLFHLW